MKVSEYNERLAKLLLERAQLKEEEGKLLLAFGHAESAIKKIGYDIHELRAKFSRIDLEIIELEQGRLGG